MKKYAGILLLTLGFCMASTAQNVGINTTTPDASSELDITSSNKGFLTPRMTEAQRNAIAAPATGLLIYQINAAPGFYVYDGTHWTPMNNAEGLFTANINTILYRNPNNFDKSFLVNTETIDYDGSALNYKMMFLPAKEGAFRAGATSVSTWSLDNIGKRSFAAGDNSMAKGDYSTALGYHTTALGEYAMAMGKSTQATGVSATAIGAQTTASAQSATAMGEGTKASGIYSTALGFATTASGANATVMGNQCSAPGAVSTAMGNRSLASGTGSMAMGDNARAFGINSTAIGTNVTAVGDYSTALGNNVSTGNMKGSFIIGDAGSTVYQILKENQMVMRFAGGYKLLTSLSTYVSIDPGGNSWTTHSDSTKKENYQAPEDFLPKIAKMRIGSWNYRGQDKKRFRHYGPMAQEFYQNFGHDNIGIVGCDTTIASADIDGVMMIAIQQLIRENTRLKATVQSQGQILENKNKKLSQRLSALEEKLNQVLSLQK